MSRLKHDSKRGLFRFLESVPRVTPACPHVADGCGGCLLQEIPYADQVAAKATLLKELYGRDVVVHPCADPLGYRSRMDYVIAFGNMGLRRRGSYRHVVDIKDCLLLPDRARAAYRIARGLLERSGLEPHDYLAHTGYLKYLTIRHSRSTGDLMLILTTAPPRSEEEGSLTRAVLSAMHEQTGATSTWWAHNGTKSDMSVGVPHVHLGSDHITEDIAGVRLCITPTTFSQGNAPLAGDLFVRAATFASGDVLDLYCGTGIFGIITAKQEGITSVVGVDVVSDSIAAATRNAAENGVADLSTFHVSDAAAYLKECAQQFDTVLCDPNRPGLGADACALLLRLSPRRIVYVSCNPDSHREDLKRLSAMYDLNILEAYDLFPQTPHIELLSVLQRKC